MRYLPKKKNVGSKFTMEITAKLLIFSIFVAKISEASDVNTCIIKCKNPEVAVVYKKKDVNVWDVDASGRLAFNVYLKLVLKGCLVSYVFEKVVVLKMKASGFLFHAWMEKCVKCCTLGGQM